MYLSNDLTKDSTINPTINNDSSNSTSFKLKYLKFILNYQTYFTAFILCSMNVINVTDRYIVSSVLIDVQNYFQVSKSTAGLLQTAFLLCYMSFSPLNGYLGDRINRKYLLIFSIIIWITSTTTGSLVSPNQFILFVLSRCLFGVATASFEVIAIPIIGDRFANNHTIRNRVVTLFCLGPPLGTGLSYLISIIAKDIKPDDWRYSMRITPILLFLILILIFLTYIEPSRGNEQIVKKSNRFLDDLKQLAKNKTYILLNLSWTLGLGSLGGFTWWSPTLIDYSLRYQNMTSVDEFKKAYSILQALAGVVGMLLPFKLSGYFKKKSWHTFDCFFISAGFFGSSLFLYIYLTSIWLDSYFTITVYMLMLVCFNLCWVLETNIFLDIIPPYLRSTGNSFMICLLHGVGDSVSPYWVGLIADKCLSIKNSNTITSLLYCTQLSNYPLVFLYFFSGTFALFTSLTFLNDKDKALLAY